MSRLFIEEAGAETLVFSRFTFNASHSKPTSPHVFLNTVNSPTFQKDTKCDFEVIIYVQFKQIQSLKKFSTIQGIGYEI